MKIGILGAGFIGSAMAALAVRAGHQAMISNSRDPRTLADTAAELGCEAGSAEEAARFGDVVVIAVPFNRRNGLPATALAGKIVIDTCNYYPDRDGQIEALDKRETTTSQLLAAALPQARVVKAFNAILAKDLDPRSSADGAASERGEISRSGQPAGTANRRALPLASDYADARQIVSALVDEFGFDPVDAGALAESWRFERAKPVYCIPFNRAGLIGGLAAATRDAEQPHGSWRR
ncbi:NAD(P)-binding domain-containing protein [Paraburkholderia xenovorans]|uniref:NADPH-dependent F420 reductase n=1 Tax=Paraburkholderia xenovorans TaxID=36873 RepID=UPI0038B8BC74